MLVGLNLQTISIFLHYNKVSRVAHSISIQGISKLRLNTWWIFHQKIIFVTIGKCIKTLFFSGDAGNYQLVRKHYLFMSQYLFIYLSGS